VSVTTSYTLWLKHMPVIDVAAVAAGFVVRAIAGAVATHVHVSNWFLIVASFGSLLMVAGKRSCELREAQAETHRSVLSEYPAEYLSHLRVLSAGMTLLAYTLFAFERASLSPSSLPLFQLSVLPFALAVLRYLLRLDQGEGGAPEDLVLGDRSLQVLGLAWAVLFLIGVYAR
jgi:decaprenyl-phosphate phosphoribosyltransferase